MLYKQTYITCLLAILTSSSVLARTISLDEYLRRASEKNHSIEAVLNNLKQKDYLKGLKLNPAYTILGLRNQFGVDPKDQSKTSSIGTKIEKTSPDAGRKYSLELNHSKSQEIEENLIKAQIGQNILKNSFGRHYRIGIAKVKLEQEIIDLQVLEHYEDIIQNFSLYYLDWQLASLSLRASKDQANRFEKIVGDIKAKLTQSIAHPLDLKKAEYQLLLRRENVLAQEGRYRAYTSRIRSLIKLPGDISPAQKVATEMRTLVLRNDQVHQEVGRTRKISIFKLRENINKYETDLAKEQYRPELDLFLGYQHGQSNRSNIKTDAGDAFLGLSLNYPIGDTQKNAQIQQATFEKSMVYLEMLSAKEELASALTDLGETINSEIKMVGVLALKWQLAKEIMASELKRFEQGEIELQALIDAESRLAESQYSYLKHQVFLAKKRIEWANMTDRLVSKLPSRKKIPVLKTSL